MSNYLDNKRYYAFLLRVREQIINGMKLEYEDSNTIGNKYIHCSWGQCSCSRRQWPDKEDYMFGGRDFKSNKWDQEDIQYQLERGIESPQSHPLAIKCHKENQMCPFDKRNSGSPDGCFYHCRIFGGEEISKERAIELYDLRIEQYKERKKI